jgi:hypothetical protein
VQDRKERWKGVDPTFGWMANPKYLILAMIVARPFLPHRQPSPYFVPAISKHLSPHKLLIKHLFMLEV